tara:strand:+ start:4046 stop:6004 length:1959 start_codon:yes stop_codon:yes gene_type:complete
MTQVNISGKTYTVTPNGSVLGPSGNNVSNANIVAIAKAQAASPALNQRISALNSGIGKVPVDGERALSTERGFDQKGLYSGMDEGLSNLLPKFKEKQNLSPFVNLVGGITTGAVRGAGELADFIGDTGSALGQNIGDYFTRPVGLDDEIESQREQKKSNPLGLISDDIFSEAAAVEAQAERDSSYADAAASMAAAGQKREKFPNRPSGTFTSSKETNNKENIVKDSANNASDEDEDNNASSVPGADTPAKEATVNALDEYLKLARPGIAPKDYDEYMKEFADATGLDVSGQPDNSQALMAFGLALMQNKAGKGFNVGEILSATGAAGEKAMPALEKARNNAKTIRAKAGEYALGRKKEDQAAAMKREQFYVIPKGKLGGPLGVVDAITKGKGEFADLNSYELNNLNTNEEFNSQYEIVKASDYSELVKEALKTPEVKDLYQTGSTPIALFDGAPKDIGLMVQLPDLNNPKARGMVPGIQGGAAESIQYVRDMEKDLGKQKEFFGGIAGLLNRTGTGAVEQTRSAIVQGLRNLGLDAGGETDPIKQIQVMLTELKAKNAAQILGESGKTLSDNDRKMVAEIVGGISFTDGDEALLVQKLGRLYDAVVGKAEQNLNQAYRTLDSYGVKYGNSKRDTGVRKGKDDQGEYIDLTSQ